MLKHAFTDALKVNLYSNSHSPLEKEGIKVSLTVGIQSFRQWPIIANDQLNLWLLVASSIGCTDPLQKIKFVLFIVLRHLRIRISLLERLMILKTPKQHTLAYVQYISTYLWECSAVYDVIITHYLVDPVRIRCFKHEGKERVILSTVKDLRVVWAKNAATVDLTNGLQEWIEIFFLNVLRKINSKRSQMDGGWRTRVFLDGIENECLPWLFNRPDQQHAIHKGRFFWIKILARNPQVKSYGPRVDESQRQLFDHLLWERSASKWDFVFYWLILSWGRSLIFIILRSW